MQCREGFIAYSCFQGQRFPGPKSCEHCDHSSSWIREEIKIICGHDQSKLAQLIGQ